MKIKQRTSKFGSYFSVRPATMGYAGTTVRAEITTLTYTFPPRNGAWNDVPQEINEAVNLFDK